MFSTKEAAEFTLHPKQAEVYKWLFDYSGPPTYKVGVVAATRGFGKSILGAITALSAVNELLQLPAHVANKRVAILAPSRDQVRSIYYDIFEGMMNLSSKALKHRRDDDTYEFPRNVKLMLRSYGAAERMRGGGLYFAVLDELSSWSLGDIERANDLVYSIILPSMATRWSEKIVSRPDVGAPSAYRLLAISSPRGFDTFHNMWEQGQLGDPHWRSWRFTYKDAPHLDEAQIEAQRAVMDPLRFAQEYLAEFRDTQLTVFYMFDRRKNVFDDRIVLGEHEPVHIGLDFNVGINAAVFAVVRDGKIYVFGEHYGSSNTEESAVHFRRLFDNGRRPIYVYPDPSGKARKTSAPAGVTDFSILRDAGFNVMAPKSSPKLIDSVNTVNMMFENARGERRLFVHRDCHQLIMSLERTRWTNNNGDSVTIDKSSGVEHWTDALRYMVHYMENPSERVKVRVSNVFF